MLLYERQSGLKPGEKKDLRSAGSLSSVRECGWLPKESLGFVYFIFCPDRLQIRPD